VGALYALILAHPLERVPDASDRSATPEVKERAVPVLEVAEGWPYLCGLKPELVLGVPVDFVCHDLLRTSVHASLSFWLLPATELEYSESIRFSSTEPLSDMALWKELDRAIPPPELSLLSLVVSPRTEAHSLSSYFGQHCSYDYMALSRR
jgi:hypothetical protein